MLYNTTNQRPWSQTVKRRRLSFFSHMARLPDDDPAKRALNEFRDTIAKNFREVKSWPRLSKLKEK